MESQGSKGHISALFSKLKELWAGHKIIICTVAAATVLCIVALVGSVVALQKKPEAASQTESTSSVSAVVESVYDVSEVSEPTETSSEESVSSAISESSKPASSTPKKTESKKEQTVSVSKPTSTGDYKYNSNNNIEDNVFLDALIYTGYNIEKHRADGRMWQYILAANKRGLGYLSKISYAGGSSGYETSGGKPDIKYFEKHGLVCASYVTYVYFNYLPNVAGIDTSSLPKPTRSTSANDWYLAAKQWLNKGYSRKIPFTASKTSAGFINFKPSESIPIGSIIVCCDARNKNDYGTHVSIYAGYKNNYNWIFHVGNKNGPEFCAIERLHFGPDPQWPLAVITPPSNIRMSAMLEVSVTDENGKPVSGASVSLKNIKSGANINLGTSNSKALTEESLSYGDYTLSFTVPTGYTADSTEKSITLTTANNSKNTVNIKLAAIPAAPAPVESSSTPSDSAISESSSFDTADESSSSEESQSIDCSSDLTLQAE